LSAWQNRVQRFAGICSTRASLVAGRTAKRESQVVDGDKSPAESGDKSPHAKAHESPLQAPQVIVMSATEMSKAGPPLPTAALA
jgi:hypothetical protein